MATSANLHTDDTIAAIATPIGVGGIGVVIKSVVPVLSATAEAIFRKKNLSASSSFLEPRHFYTGYIVDQEKNETVDEVLIVSMPATGFVHRRRCCRNSVPQWVRSAGKSSRPHPEP